MRTWSSLSSLSFWQVSFAKQETTSMTSAAADIAPELEKLRRVSVQKIREFLLQRVASLKKKMTNIQILQQSVHASVDACS